MNDTSTTSVGQMTKTSSVARFVAMKEKQRVAEALAVENAKRRKERYYPILPLIPKKRLLHDGAQLSKAQASVG